MRVEGSIPRDIGWDLSAAAIWRPKATQNLVFRLSAAALLPGKGLRDLFDNFGGHRRYYSLLAEVSHSEFKPVNRETVVDETIQGLVNTRMISDADRKDIVDAYLIERDYTYPTPSLERDRALATIHPFLESRDVYSRGRFGAWRYEVGNMDHSVAQGVEWVNRIVCHDEANELTYLAKRGC